MTSILSSITSAFESEGTMKQIKLANITSESAKKLREKYPDRIPVIIENVDNRVTLRKHKFLVPLDLSVGQLVYIIRKHANNLQPSEALFIFISKKQVLPQTSTLIRNIYEEYNNDGFVKLDVSLENTFG